MNQLLERRKSLACILFVVLLIACLTVQGGIHIVEALATPAMRVDPQVTKNVAPSGTFNINIKVTDIAITKRLYAWQFRLEFNASILQVTSVTWGWFLTRMGKTAWKDWGVTPEIDNVNGAVTAGDMLLPDEYTGEYPPGDYGSGPVATITFQVQANGVSLLYLSYTYLASIVSGYTDPITPHDRFHGYFESPAKTHDIAVTSVTASPAMVVIGDLVSINATVKNEGQVTETFKVTAYYNITIQQQPSWTAIETKTFMDLAPAAETTITFTWDTKAIAAGKYTIKANAYLVDRNHPDASINFLDTHTADNTYTDGTVTVHSPPVASFTHSPTQPITGKTASFNSTSHDPDGSIVSWAWDLNGDGSTDATTENTTYTYTEAGTYTVNLTVTDNDGLTDTTTKDITVLAHDIAITAIWKDVTQVMAGVPVTITVTVRNNGDFSEKFNVTTYYDNTPIATNTSCWTKPLTAKETRTLTFTWDTTGISLGIYTLKAVATTVTDEINIANNELIDDTVIVAPVNIFDYRVDVGGVTFHVFIETNSTISSFKFIRADKKINFNVTGLGGTIGYCNVTIPKRLLDANATHPWLILLDATNITDTASVVENATHTFIYFTYNLSTRNVEIKGAIVATPPTTSFTPSTTSAYVGDPVTFDASASYDPDGTIVSYEWDFGDKTSIITELDPIATHTYTAAGLYTVTLTVIDNDGLKGISRTNITLSWVHDVAVTNITAFPNIVKIGELVYINATVANKGNSPDPETFTVTLSHDDIIIYLWQRFHVGEIAAGKEKTLNCTWDTTDVDPGTYTLKAVASTVTDEINTTNNQLIGGTVTVASIPVASFTISPNPPYYIGDTLTFDASASHDPDGHIISYKWNFSDGTPIVTETDPLTTHKYTAAGNHVVTLTVTDNQSLTDIATRTLTVSAKHDVGVVNITPSKNKATVGELVSINVTVVNQGTQAETFNITVYYDNKIIETKSVTNLASGASETITINWDTTDVDPGTYTLKAVASTVIGETNTANNERTGGTVTITAQEAALNIIIYVAAAGAAAIIILAVAFYFLRARKQSGKGMVETPKSSKVSQHIGERKIHKRGSPVNN